MSEFERNQRTEVSELGEFALIDHLTAQSEPKNLSTVKGIGDDAAVILHGNNGTLVSTDLLLEGIHFDLAYVPLKHLGYKAVVVNLSDIYAMNGEASQITVSIGITNRFSLEALEEFYEGVKQACQTYQVDMVGGDTSASQKGFVISVTSIGYAPLDKICYRNTAKQGDLICVTGDLGAAYMGLQLLEREKIVLGQEKIIQPDLDGKDYILERQLKPEARRDVVKMLAVQNVKPTAMIDISDGLASEILHICNQSNTGCVLFEEKIPIDPMTVSMAFEFGIDPTLCALSGGEDYELLFTVPYDDLEKIKGIADVTKIGYMTGPGEGQYLQSKKGTRHEIKAQGWKAF